jgi:hypothetical protein
MCKRGIVSKMQVSLAGGLGNKWSDFQEGKEALELQER